MDQELYAVCPECGSRGKVISFHWNRGESFALVQCACGRTEVPYEESRVLEICVNNPYLRQDHFRLLIPVAWEQDDKWHKVGQLLMSGWRW